MKRVNFWSGRNKGALPWIVTSAILAAICFCLPTSVPSPETTGPMIRCRPLENESMDALTGLEHSDPGVREGAASALAGRPDEALRLLGPLTKALDDEDERVRQQAAVTLGTIGPAARTAVPTLVRHLQDKQETNRAIFALSLRGIGAGAGDAVPALRGAIEENNDIELRRAAASALQTMGRDAPAACQRY